MGSLSPTARLGEVVENLDSRRIPLSSRERATRRGPFPYYGATGILDHVDDYLFEGLHLLIAEDGSVEDPEGRPVLQLVDGRFWVNNHAHVLRAATDEDTRFLYYALSTINIRPYLSGSVQVKLTQTNLNRIEVPYPDADTRAHIARVLGAIDDKIKLNRRMARTLEEIARAIFKSWFVDFDPVRAKMDGRHPFGLDAKVAAMFPNSLEQSPFGEIPAGWKVGSMRDLVALSRESIRPSDSPGELFEHYSIPAFDDGRLPARERGSDIRSNKFVVGSGVVLLSKLNPRLPRVWLPTPAPGRRSIASTEFLVTTPRPGFSREYVYSVLRSDEFIERFSGLVTGTSGSHQRVKPEDFLDMLVVLPHPRAADVFEAVTKPLFEMIAVKTRESESLATVRNTLLPRLISGEIRLPESGSRDSRHD